MPDIEFPTSAGTAPGYLAVPAGEHGPATIVMQEWWGVDEHIRSVCDRFAAEGFFALAPDLYRGETTTQPSEAEQKMMALSMEQVRAGHVRRRRLPRNRSRASRARASASVGFCLGGGLSVWAAATCPQITAAVSYYYVMPHGKPDFANITGPVLGHFGTADAFVPRRGRAGARSGAQATPAWTRTFHYYEGAGHAFFNDTDRLGTYDAELAEQLLGAHGELPALRARLLTHRGHPSHRASPAGPGGPALPQPRSPRSRSPCSRSPQRRPARPRRPRRRRGPRRRCSAAARRTWRRAIAFPSDKPDHATGAGAIVWSARAAAPAARARASPRSAPAICPGPSTGAAHGRGRAARSAPARWRSPALRTGRS